jgi:hypothetical protein
MEWSAKAAAGDALSRVPAEGAFVAVWMEGDNVRWSMANTDGLSLAVLAMVLQELAGAQLREKMR